MNSLLALFVKDVGDRIESKQQRKRGKNRMKALIMATAIMMVVSVMMITHNAFLAQYTTLQVFRMNLQM